MAVTVNDHDIVIGHASLHDVRLEPEVPTTTDQERSAPNTVRHIFRFHQMRQYGQAKNRGSSFDAHVGAEQVFTIVVMVKRPAGVLVKPTPPWWPGAAQNIHGCRYISSAR